jgi:hypothetical protein
VQQGDPLGPFLFALGIHPALRVVQQRWPGVHVLAYLDDVHLVGPQASVHGAFLELRRQFAAIGLSTRADKNHVWSPSERYAPVWSWPAADMGGVLPARISRGGYDVLGVPCCPAEQLAQRVLQRCMDPAAKGRPNFAHAEAALRGLATAEPKRGPQSALVLMRFCALPKVGYLLRALPPAATAPMAAAVDAAARAQLRGTAAGARRACAHRAGLLGRLSAGLAHRARLWWLRAAVCSGRRAASARWLIAGNCASGGGAQPECTAYAR